MRLLQLPVTDLEQAIKEEVERNPLLEAEEPDVLPLPQTDNQKSDWDSDEDDDYDYHEHLESDPNAVHRELVVADSLSATERILAQLHLKQLPERLMTIADEIVGTLDDAGYLGRDLALIANDLAFRQGIEASDSEMQQALGIVQSLDPAGIGARNLRECLLLQLQRIDPADEPAQPDALAILDKHFDDFASHRYEHLCDTLGLTEERLAEATELIRHLNPKPAGSSTDDRDAAAPVIPDIVLTQHDGQLHFYLNDGHLPLLSLNEYYVDMLHSMEQEKGNRATVQFLRTKQADAQQFIDLLKQRHNTIERVMRYIVRHQRQYLLTGNPDLLLPLRQREVAEATGLDISTVSRMANSKYLQTDFGTIALKECFSKGVATGDGEEVSVETIKQRIAHLIEDEDKHAPLSDDALAQALHDQGMPIARRTVAKYREQLGLPVARLRRLIVWLLLVAGGTLGLQAQQSYYDSVVAARIARAAVQPQTKAQAAEKPTEKKTVGGRKAVRPEADKVAEESPTAEAYTVPMWYDAFPANRVNPLGRTDLSQLPDEINLLLVRDSADFCFPVRGVRSSAYGWRWQRGHHGVDIALRTGDKVYAAFGGTVRVASRMGGYGNCVVVRHPNGLETLYGHLSKINVARGQHVKAGDVVGLGGSTGNSTGPHLHFECRFLYQTFDPEWILDFQQRTLRTRRLHLDKSYFGIRQPRQGEQVAYKADRSIIVEGKKRPKNKPTVINSQDF